jgi:hypothetical protein
MQAIETKYFGPTNVKGSRIKAECAAGSVTIGYDHAINLEENHIAAARHLIAKLGWDALDLATGCLKSGNYCHVLI